MFSIQTFSGWLTLGLLVAAIVFWWWSTQYLRDIPNTTHALLIRLFRFMTVVGIVLLLSDFRVQWTERNKISPSIAVFVDNSKSMDRFNVEVMDTVNTFKKLINEAGGKITTKTFGFADDVYPVGDEGDLNFAGNRSDLSTPLGYITDHRQSENILAAVILSDGIHNSGPAPQSVLENRSVPLFTVFTGDTTAVPDIEISEFTIPAYTYAGDSINASVTLGVQNLSNDDTAMVEVQGSAVSEKTTVPLPMGNYSKRIQIPLHITEPGEYQLAAVSDSVVGEKNTLNNKAHSRISVKPARYNINILSEAPSLETRFLVKTIQELERFEEAASFTNLDPVEDIAGKADSADIVYVIGTPPGYEDIAATGVFDKIIYQVGSRGDIPHEQLRTTGNRSWLEANVVLSGRQNNPLSALRNTVSFDKLPPVWILNTGNAVKGIPLLIASESDLPAITREMQSERRIITIFARDLWRWTFAAQESAYSPGNQVNSFTRVMEQLFFWLLRDTDFQRLQVTVDIGRNNRITAGAQVFKPSLEPADVARVWGELLDSTGTVLQRNLYSKHEENYRLRVHVRQPGTYRLRTRAYTSTDTLDHLSEPIAVPELNYELLDRKGQPGRLRALSEQTRGEYLHSIANFPVTEYAGRPATYASEQHTFALRRAYWFWALLVILFGFDWWLRRRNGIL